MSSNPSSRPSCDLSASTSPAAASTSVASVTGMLHGSPFASRISSTTARQSSDPWNPRSGLKPPTASSSRSAAWRALSVTAARADPSFSRSSRSPSGTSRSMSSPPWGSIKASLLGLGRVQAALDLFLTRPAAGARVLAWHHLARAVRASDRRVVPVVQRVVGNLVLANVGPDVVEAPVRQRVRLHESELLVPLDLLRVRPRGGLVAADAGDPGVDLAERALQGLDLANRAALVGSALPKLVTVQPRLLLEADVVEALELEAVSLREAVARLVRLREQDVGVEVEDPNPWLDPVQHVEQHRLLLLERARDVEAR